jgi:hypothetical protein
MTGPIDPPFCPFCPHELHSGKKCLFCKCKGKAKQGFWKAVISSIGNAVGNAKFGGGN